VSEFDWSDEKNALLERDRGICFEEIIVHINNGRIRDIIRHPNRDRYPGRNNIVIDIDGYVWLVPYTKNKGRRFLKTIIPSRKATRGYLR
jgi:hypothetical protein